jgi:hypothetical protein
MQTALLALLGVLLASGSWLLEPAQGAPAAGPPTPDAARRQVQKDGEFYLTGVWSGLESLNSGVVVASMTVGGDGLGKDQRVEWFEAFDQKTGTVRYDRQTADGRIVQFVRLPSEILFRLGAGTGTYSIGRYPLDYKFDGFPDAIQGDVRTLGLTNWGELMCGLTLDAQRKHWSSTTLSECTPDGDGIYRLTWNCEKGPVPIREALWIDVKRGYVPLKLESSCLRPKAKQWEINETANTTWKQINGVLVPVRAELSSRTGIARHAKILLEWKSVNEPIDRKIFAMEGLGLPDGTSVINYKLGTPIEESVIGPPNHASFNHRGGRSSPQRLTRNLIIANIGLLSALLLGRFYMRRMR